MAKTRDYMDYLDESVDIAPANSQEEYQAAETIADVLRDHDLETSIEEFDAHPWSTLVSPVTALLMLVLLVVGGVTDGAVHILCLLLSAALAGLTLFLHFTGSDLLANIGPASRSQNVVAVHRAEGDKVVKGARPIVIVAHYDTPRQSLLYAGPLARYQSTLRLMTIPCYIAVAVSVLFQIMLFLPAVFRTVMWVVGLVAMVPLVVLAALDIHSKFAPCTVGSNDNKSSVAALLSLANKVRPAEDRVSGGAEADSEERPERRRVRRAGDAKPAPAVPRQVEVVEEVHGVRHGANVLASLGILPPDCEIVYQEPRVHIVDEAPAEIPSSDDLSSDDLAVEKDSGAYTNDRDEDFVEDAKVNDEDVAKDDEVAPAEGDSGADDEGKASSAARRTVAPILPPLEDDDQDDDFENDLDVDYDEDEYDEGFDERDDQDEDADYDEDESYDEDDEDWEGGSGVGAWFSGVFANIKDRFANMRSAKESDEELDEEEDYDEDYDDSDDFDGWMDYDDEDEEEYVEDDEDFQEDQEDDFEDSQEEYEDEYIDDEEDEYEDEEYDEGDDVDESAYDDLEDDVDEEYSEDDLESEEEASEEEAIEAADKETDDEPEAEELVDEGPVSESSEEPETKATDLISLIPSVEDDELEVPVVSAPVESEAEQEDVDDEVQGEVDAGDAYADDDVDDFEQEVELEDDEYQEDDETYEDEYEEEEYFEEDYEDEAEYDDESVEDEPYEEDFEDEEEYDDQDAYDDEEYDDEEYEEDEYEEDEEDEYEDEEYEEEAGYEGEDEYRPSLKDRIANFFSKIRMGEPEETDVEYNEYGAPVEDEYEEGYEDDYTEEFEDQGVFEDAYDEDDFYEEDYSEEVYEDSTEVDFDYNDEAEDEYYEPEEEGNPYMEEEFETEPYGETVYEGEMIDDEEFSEEYENHYDDVYEDEFVDVELDFDDDLEDEYENEPQAEAPQPEPLSDPNLLHFDREEDEDIAPRDTTGLDMISDSYDLYTSQNVQAEPRRRPEPLGDPSWGVTSYQPARPAMNIARRAALFDLPDPSAATVDPFDDDYDIFEDYEEEYADDGLYEDVPQGEYQDSRSTQDATYPGEDQSTGPIEGGDAWTQSAQRDGQGDASSQSGFWGDSSRKSDWKGGATTREDLRNEGEEPLVIDADDLQDAILELGDDYLISHDIWFVATGASEVNHAGIRAFIDEHRRDIRGAFLVNLDSVGAGELSVIVREGLHAPRRADRRLVRMITGIAHDLHIQMSTAAYNWDERESASSMRSRVRSVTIAGLDENNLPAHSHTSGDLPENVDPRQVSDVVRIVTELIRRS